MSFTTGDFHRTRLVNGAIDTHFKFIIDDYNITVISMDLVPITPYTTQVLSIGMGQRFDIVVEASESSGNYWMRAIPQTTCSDNDNFDNIKGIVMYDTTNTTEPDTPAYT
jgi:FtsP/CotA-like multicopper oxidase with cupredoxin domain